METIRAKAFAILDGALLPIARIAADIPYFSGKHKHDGMNGPGPRDPFGRLPRASPALPGSIRDLTAAWQQGIIETLADAGLKCWADKAWQGAGGTVRVPFRGRRLKRWKRRHNSRHVKIRCLGEQAMATLKGWRLLREVRCSTNRITDKVKAVLVLCHASSCGWKRAQPLGSRTQVRARGPGSVAAIEGPAGRRAHVPRPRPSPLAGAKAAR
ncbi:hypothetical protein FHS35_002045 [Streptomyces umbrinus]|nr:hypothetical protein [Streptomyces umbrinus]GHH63233.1 hypothetical protein GCM10018775_80630 [Streptomyces umbrinus]